MLTLDLLLLSPPWTIKFQGALTLSTFLAFAYCKSLDKSACPPPPGGDVCINCGRGEDTGQDSPSEATSHMATEVQSLIASKGAWIEYTFSHNQT